MRIMLLGNIIAGLNPVDGTTGINKTKVSALVGGAVLTALTQCLYYVHLNDGTGLSTIVAQGNIGSNIRRTDKTYSVTANGTLLCFNFEGLPT
jgi:hypothetical protein